MVLGGHCRPHWDKMVEGGLHVYTEGEGDPKLRLILRLVLVRGALGIAESLWKFPFPTMPRANMI